MSDHDATMDSRPWGRIAVKLGLGLLGLSALVTEVAVLTERGTFDAVNFFSYFTVLSNVVVAGTLLASAMLTAAGRGERLDELRAATTLYILVVGIGFTLLLSSMEGVAFTAVPWDNIVLHYLVPIGVAVDLVIDPPRRQFRFRRGLWWLAFPLAYLAYTLVRGKITDWYPYPFLDPATDGAGAVAISSAAMLVLGVLLVWGVCVLTRRSALSPAGR